MVEVLKKSRVTHCNILREEEMLRANADTRHAEAFSRDG
jgi:hypothetical protein